MKLAAIYNVWDGEELLPGSINSIRHHVDVIIIVYQKISNYGEEHDPMAKFNMIDSKIVIEFYRPNLKLSPQQNETAKRNIGIEIAQMSGCTHFLHMDCDEYYENFGIAKRMYELSGYSGSVVKLYTYFVQPIYRLTPIENYYVPFIHELHTDTKAGNVRYPFYVDPTRKINQKNIVELPVYMHHFSYVRKNIMRKINNSTAKVNISKGTILEDYNFIMQSRDPNNFYVRDYDRRIKIVDNIFNLPVF